MSSTLIAPDTTATFTLTLASALAWAGHDCDGGCPAAAARVPAALWLVRRSPSGRSSWNPTLVVLDLGESHLPGAELRALLRAVQDCARRDHIQVRERMLADRGHALAAVGDLSRSTPAPRRTADGRRGPQASGGSSCGG